MIYGCIINKNGGGIMGLFDDSFDLDGDGRVNIWELDEIGLLDDDEDFDSDDFDDFDSDDEW